MKVPADFPAFVRFRAGLPLSAVRWDSEQGFRLALLGGIEIDMRLELLFWERPRSFRDKALDQGFDLEALEYPGGQLGV